jgi:hypothetical protein
MLFFTATYSDMKVKNNVIMVKNNVIMLHIFIQTLKACHKSALCHSLLDGFTTYSYL